MTAVLHLISVFVSILRALCCLGRCFCFCRDSVFADLIFLRIYCREFPDIFYFNNIVREKFKVGAIQCASDFI